jgi:hypothetical protein
MIKRKLNFFLVVLIILIGSYSSLEAGLDVTPLHVFINQSRGSMPLNIRNPGNTTIEVWLEAKFGYVTSNDSGQSIINYDTVGTPSQSAVPWLKFYPQRFRLEPLGSQVVRVMVFPPANLPDGEYWARILVGNRDTKDINQTAGTAKGKSGMIFIQQVGLPLHYRKGKTTTGLDIKSFDFDITVNKIKIRMDMDRLGNASYWGGATFSIVDAAGKRVSFSKKDIVVYTKYHAVIEIDRSKIKPGTYSLDVDISPGLRSDMRKTDLISSEPIHITKSIILD